MPTANLKVAVNSTLSPQNVDFVDQQIAAGRFPNRSAAIDYAIYHLANVAPDLEKTCKRIDELYEDSRALRQTLEDAKGDALELWKEVQELGSRLLLFSHERKALEARIENLEAEKAKRKIASHVE